MAVGLVIIAQVIPWLCSSGKSSGVTKSMELMPIDLAAKQSVSRGMGS
jgi:hypothetical protein